MLLARSLVLPFEGKTTALMSCCAAVSSGKTTNFRLHLLQAVLVSSVHHYCEVSGMHKPKAAVANEADAGLEQAYVSP